MPGFILTKSVETRVKINKICAVVEEIFMNSFKVADINVQFGEEKEIKPN